VTPLNCERLVFCKSGGVWPSIVWHPSIAAARLRPGPDHFLSLFLNSGLGADLMRRPWQNRDKTPRVEPTGDALERKADSPSCWKPWKWR